MFSFLHAWTGPFIPILLTHFSVGCIVSCCAWTLHSLLVLAVQFSFASPHHTRVHTTIFSLSLSFSLVWFTFKLRCSFTFTLLMHFSFRLHVGYTDHYGSRSCDSPFTHIGHTFIRSSLFTLDSTAGFSDCTRTPAWDATGLCCTRSRCLHCGHCAVSPLAVWLVGFHTDTFTVLPVRFVHSLDIQTTADTTFRLRIVLWFMTQFCVA